MNRMQRALMVAVVGMVILGFSLVTTVKAVQPPPRWGWPEGSEYGTRIGWQRNAVTVISESEACYFLNGWRYWVEPGYDERELFPQPIKYHLFIGAEEIHLSRNTIGVGNLPENGPDEYFVGPLFRWYQYFEPYHFRPGTYVIRFIITYKYGVYWDTSWLPYDEQPRLVVLPE
ncbi:MAG: hypothetical protein ACFFER_06110 [Candidatus Thorarchaeota archaeon]